MCLSLFSTILTVHFYRQIWGWFIPELIFYFFTTAAFIRMRNNLETSEDKKSRQIFSRTYNIFVLILNPLWQIIKSLGLWGNFAKDFCSMNQRYYRGSYDQHACESYIRTDILYQQIFGILLLAYFATVVRKFADAASDNGGVIEIDVAPAQEPLVYQQNPIYPPP